MADKVANYRNAVKSFESRVSKLVAEHEERLAALQAFDRERGVAEARHLLKVKRERLAGMKNPAKIERERSAIAGLEQKLAEASRDRAVLERGLDAARTALEVNERSLATARKRLAEAEKEAERLRLKTEAEARARAEEERREKKRFQNRVACRGEKLGKRLDRRPDLAETVRALKAANVSADDPRVRSLVLALEGRPDDEADRLAVLELIEEAKARAAPAAAADEPRSDVEERIRMRAAELARELDADDKDPETRDVMLVLAREELGIASAS